MCVFGWSLRPHYWAAALHEQVPNAMPSEVARGRSRALGLGCLAASIPRTTYRQGDRES